MRITRRSAWLGVVLAAVGCSDPEPPPPEPETPTIRIRGGGPTGSGRSAEEQAKIDRLEAQAARQGREARTRHLPDDDGHDEAPLRGEERVVFSVVYGDLGGFKVSDVKLERGEDAWVASATIKNQTGRSYGHVALTVDFLGSSNRPIDTARFELSDFQHGERRRARTEGADLDDEVRRLKICCGSTSGERRVAGREVQVTWVKPNTLRAVSVKLERDAVSYWATATNLGGRELIAEFEGQTGRLKTSRFVEVRPGVAVAEGPAAGNVVIGVRVSQGD